MLKDSSSCSMQPTNGSNVDLLNSLGSLDAPSQREDGNFGEGDVSQAQKLLMELEKELSA